MAKGNGAGEFPVKAGLSLEEKIDTLVDALVDIREQLEVFPEQMEELKEQVQRIEEKLDSLGFPGDGFGVERYN